MFFKINYQNIDWDALEDTFPFLNNLKGSTQSALYHQEGDVYIHTKLVIEALLEQDDFHKLSSEQKEMMFLTALFHDIAKPVTRIEEDGFIKNPHHSRIGAMMSREILYDMGYPAFLREQLCNIISVHQDPFWIIEKDDKTIDYLTIKMSLITGSIKNLCLQARADMIGRICPDQDSTLLNIDLFEEHAKSMGCWDKPFEFANLHTKRQYLIDYKNKSPYLELYDPTEFTVNIMCGLPGSGKSTYAKTLGLPIISMDDIREELHISPTDDQGIIRQEFLKRTKQMLAKKQDFIIDNVNLDKTRRASLIDLCCAYKAKVNIVYKELDFKTCLERNMSRNDCVPVHIWKSMIKKMELPTHEEAHTLKIILESSKKEHSLTLE